MPLLITTQSYLGESALVWKAEPKLAAVSGGERSQGRSARIGHEEARLRYSPGWRLGLADGRASAPLAKPDPLPPQRVPKRSRRLFALANRVTDAIMERQGCVHTTDEVPPDRGVPCPVRSTHKAPPKGWAHVRGQRRASHPPLLWGCQQRQSRPWPRGTEERQNHRKPFVSQRYMGTVSPPAPATPWPAVASCAATRLHAKKHPPTTAGEAEGSFTV